MKTVLVTGAGGYIGSVLVPKLLADGYSVKAIDRYFFGRDSLSEHENLQILQEDTRRIPKDLFDSVDFVIDLVAISNDPSGELFQEATWQINYESRARTARLSKECGVQRYILPSSCSIYGFQEEKVDEEAATNPLTTYARANEKAEQEVLKLSDGDFCVAVMRQATVYGYSRRMRFDLAVNGMTYGAWKTGKLPLMRDGKQSRPMVHIDDTTDVMLLLLQEDKGPINGQIFNVGSDENNYNIERLGHTIASLVGERLGKNIEIEWYGDPDHRSYIVNFDKIEKTLNWKAKYDAEFGGNQIIDYLMTGELDRTAVTITLEWYKELEKWLRIIRETEMYGGMLNIE